MGRSITQPTTINASATDPGCANPGASAFTGQRLVTVCIVNNGWTVHNTLNKQKILTHEVFHAVQFEMRWLGSPSGNSGAQWMIGRVGGVCRLARRGVGGTCVLRYGTRLPGAAGERARRRSDVEPRHDGEPRGIQRAVGVSVRDAGRGRDDWVGQTRPSSSHTEPRSRTAPHSGPPSNRHSASRRRRCTRSFRCTVRAWRRSRLRRAEPSDVDLRVVSAFRRTS